MAAGDGLWVAAGDEELTVLFALWDEELRGERGDGGGEERVVEKRGTEEKERKGKEGSGRGEKRRVNHEASQ